MQIAINNRRIELQYKTVLAVQYDNGTEFVDFVLDRTQYDEDLSDLTPLFLYENAAGGFIDAATKTVTDSQIDPTSSNCSISRPISGKSTNRISDKFCCTKSVTPTRAKPFSIKTQQSFSLK